MLEDTGIIMLSTPKDWVASTEYYCLTVIDYEVVMGNMHVLHILKVWTERPILSTVKPTSRA